MVAVEANRAMELHDEFNLIAILTIPFYFVCLVICARVISIRCWCRTKGWWWLGLVCVLGMVDAIIELSNNGDKNYGAVGFGCGLKSECTLVEEAECLGETLGLIQGFASALKSIALRVLHEVRPCIVLVAQISLNTRVLNDLGGEYNIPILYNHDMFFCKFPQFCAGWTAVIRSVGAIMFEMSFDYQCRNRFPDELGLGVWMFRLAHQPFYVALFMSVVLVHIYPIFPYATDNRRLVKALLLTFIPTWMRMTYMGWETQMVDYVAVIQPLERSWHNAYYLRQLVLHSVLPEAWTLGVLVAHSLTEA
jgi:hypothetical protein